ncbi:MAG: PAS domain S-box protein [Candidatus Aceula meridiana]|nr:PAS domain S-box protein [Candidatus Aceula meridiana]
MKKNNFSHTKGYLSNRFVIFYVITVIAIFFSGWFVTSKMTEYAREEVFDEGEANLHALGSSVKRILVVTERVSKLLSGSPRLLKIAELPDAQDLVEINIALDRYAETLPSSICYILNLKGEAIASSNRNQPDSFVGKNYQFRPYFQQSIEGKTGRYFAYGVTSRKRGYYVSHPVKNSVKEIIGVAVIKRDLDVLAQDFVKFSHCYLVSPDGIIFLSSHPKWVLKSLWPINDDIQKRIASSQQFGPGPFKSMGIQKILDKSEIVFHGKKFFVNQSVVSEDQWSILFLASADRVIIYRWLGIVLTLFLELLILIFIVIIYMTQKSSENARRLAAIVASSEDAIIGKTLDGRILNWNRGAEKIYGYKEKEVKGKRIDIIIPEDKRNETEDFLEKTRNGESVESYETVRRRKDGQMIDVSLNISPIRGENKKIIGASIFGRDITENKRAEKVLKEAQDALKEKAWGLERTNEAIKALYEELAVKTKKIEESQQQIVTSKESAERVFELSPSAIFIVDKDQKVTQWNKKAEELTGYQSEEVLGKKCSLFADHPCKDSCGLFDENIQKPIVGRECKIKRKDGEIRIISKNADVLKDANGNIVEGIESFEDVTARRQAEEFVSRALSKNEALVSAVSQIVYEHYFSEDRILWMGNFQEVIGYTLNEMGNSSGEWFEKCHPEDVDRVKEELEKAISEKRNFDVEYRFRHKNGQYFWFHDRGVLHFDGQGIIVSNIGLMENITKRKEVEAELIKLSSAIEQSPATVVITDPDGNIEYVNPKFCQLTGYTFEEALGQNPRVLKSDKQPPEFYKDMWDTITQAKEWRGEFCNKKKNGDLYWELASISPIRNESGKTTNYIAVKEDITARKEAEEKAKDAMRMKSEFISVVSHELRTPLTAIKEGISIVADGVTGELNKEQAEFLDVAKRNVERLARLINDVLDFQKLDTSQMTFEFANQDIAPMIKEVVMTMDKVAKKENVELKADIQENLPQVGFDHDRITQVVTNLVSNAVKYASGKPVTLQARQEGNTIKVSVIDQGDGIKEEDFSKLFQTFSQLKKGKERKTGSTGLGLAISKKIVEEHGGKIWVESKEGEGSIFSFILPIEERRKKEA